MQVTKLRVPMDENGLVPSGEYFKRLAAALRDANEKEARLRARTSTQQPHSIAC
jgi:hypothetical protein